MNIKNFLFHPSFMRAQNQTSLLSRMLGGGKKTGAMGCMTPLMSRTALRSYSKFLTKQYQEYDSFSYESPESGDEAEYNRVNEKLYRAGRIDSLTANRTGAANHTANQAVNRTGNYTPTPKATLADVTGAFDRVRSENRAKLDSAGSEITAVNHRAGRELLYASTRINGARYDYQSAQYTAGGAYLERVEQNAFDRQMVNRQIKNLLSGDGISIAEGESYTFTVDAYTNRVSVSGGDEAKRQAIEDALNRGENGKNLYEHIKLCGQWEKDLSGNYEKNEQLTDGGLALRYAGELMREKLGVNLSQVARQGDDYVTADGQSVRDLFAKYAREHPTPGFTVEAETALYHSYLDRALSDGQKMDLSIRFDAAGLHDLGQQHSYGTGDTAWIDEYVQGLAKETGKTVLTTFVDPAVGENAESEKSAEATEEKAEENSTGTISGSVGINAAKLARLLAAAKTRSQVQAVIAQIQADLDECDKGRKQGLDVDEGSCSAAEALLGQARQQLGRAANREATPEEAMQYALAGLM